ncbi:MAG: amidohydrolase family protein [Candidatus Binataceae bacterium]|nr:amidohydrolase family protein [Candidatus Binataceae bacterium]
MAQLQERIYKIKYRGAVDADGHILEAADCWEQYCEAKYKPTAIRVKTDAEGYQYFEINGTPSRVSRRGQPFSTIGNMGKVTREHGTVNLRLKYGDELPLGAMDAKDRVRRLDLEGLDAAIIYPSLGLSWETECDDAAYAQAMTRAYNRWLIDWCADTGGRLIPVAHLSLGDPVAAAAELERAVKAGCMGGWVVQFVMNGKPHAHPDHDVLFAKAEELGVPIGIHPSLEPQWALPGRYKLDYVRKQPFFLNVTASDSIRHALVSFMEYGTFEKFPKLKIIILEVGAGWASYWLDRMDAVYDTVIGRTLPIKRKPSEYFRRNVWISADPDEHSLPAMMQLCGEDRFFWASDFPHPDHTGDYMEELEELADKLPEPARAKMLGDNVRRAYNIAG